MSRRSWVGRSYKPKNGHKGCLKARFEGGTARSTLAGCTALSGIRRWRWICSSNGGSRRPRPRAFSTSFSRRPGQERRWSGDGPSDGRDRGRLPSPRSPLHSPGPCSVSRCVPTSLRCATALSFVLTATQSRRRLCGPSVEPGVPPSPGGFWIRGPSPPMKPFGSASSTTSSTTLMGSFRTTDGR